VSLLLALQGVRASLAVTLGGLALAGSGAVAVTATASLTFDGIVTLPSIVDVTTGSDSIAGSSHPVVMPATVNAGDRLMILIANTTGATFPAGWTEFLDVSVGGAIAAAYRDADGTEGGTTVTVSNGGSPTRAAWATVRITNYDTSKAPEAGSASGSDANPDPPSFSPSWGSASDLWFAVVGTAGNPPETISVYPAGYDLSQTYVAATGAAGRGILGFAARKIEAASQDPGTFTLSGSLAWKSATIAVKGAPIGTASVAITATLNTILDGLTLTGAAAVTGGAAAPDAGPVAILSGAGHFGDQPRRRRLPDDYKLEPDRTIRVWFDTSLTPRKQEPRVTKVTREVWRPGKKKPEVETYDDTADLMAIILALSEDDD
jgi:hypothetical protein